MSSLAIAGFEIIITASGTGSLITARLPRIPNPVRTDPTARKCWVIFPRGTHIAPARPH